MKKGLKYYAVAAVLFILIYLVSWALGSGLIWLICLCFGWNFSLRMATGIWLISCISFARMKSLLRKD